MTTTEAKSRADVSALCGCDETRRCMICTPSMFPNAIRLRRTLALDSVTDAEIDLALHRNWNRRSTKWGIERHMNNAELREQVRENIARGKRLNVYHPELTQRHR